MDAPVFVDVKGTTIITSPASGNSKGPAQARVDDSGNVVLPREFAERYGLHPGVDLLVEDGANSLRLRRPVTHLAKIYVEPTNACNLNCRTCIRNVWDEPLGHMSTETFDAVAEGIKRFSLPLTVFFGGFGEPLFHPRIVDMIRRAKGLGARVELITNGTLLSREMSQQIIAAGLDLLWVSLDGATPASYTDVRLAEALPRILTNLQQFHSLCMDSARPPELGIAFVAMTRNIADLPDILWLGGRFGASHYSISGVLPHTAEMLPEVLYTRTLGDSVRRPTHWFPLVRMPRFDMNETTQKAIYHILRSGRNVMMGEAHLGEKSDRCPFIEMGTMSIGWQGDVSPCLALLHEDLSFLDDRPRRAVPYSVGNVNERSMYDIWMYPVYLSFRRRVQQFEFSPCTHCGGCDFSESNKEDCFGNEFPTCGGCLWAQGVIQCP